METGSVSDLAVLDISLSGTGPLGGVIGTAVDVGFRDVVVTGKITASGGNVGASRPRSRRRRSCTT